MSYILDALRRAENERERERKGLPSLNSQLHDQAPPVDEPDDGAPAAGAKRLVWSRLALGVGLGLSVGALAWWTLKSPGAAPSADTAVAVPVAPVAAQSTPPTPAMMPAPIAAAQSPSAASAPILAPMPTVLPDPPKKPAAPAKPERKTAPQTTVQAAELGSSEKPVPQRKAQAPEAPERSVVRELSQLPEGLRRELPALVVSGSMYSPQPSARMLVLDGQVVREGDQIRPGLSVDSIEPKSAILNQRGERFRISF